MYHGRSAERSRALREKAAARLAGRRLTSTGLTSVDRREAGDDAGGGGAPPRQQQQPARAAAADARGVRSAAASDGGGSNVAAAGAGAAAAPVTAAAAAVPRGPPLSVPELLSRHGLGEYTELFRAEALDDTALLREMARDEGAFRASMKDIGVAKLGHREALLRALRAPE